jgi:hypothetical protein
MDNRDISEMEAPRPSWCRRCGYVLDWRFHFVNGVPAGGEWEHSAVLRDPQGPEWAKVPPHDPDPVADGSLAPNAACDFCSAPDPVWRYPASRFMAPQTTAIIDEDGLRTENYISDDDWAACEECHADIEDDRWGFIAERMLGRVPKPMRLVMRQQIKGLHAEFRAHRSGPPVREPARPGEAHG